jgi:hypothetical protein
MRCPTHAQLPPPPPSKTGWPWTEESSQLPETMPDGRPWPRITIVTPSYNQGQFIQETIRSVLLQGYPDVEYIVIDGGSTDGSLEIIRRYADRLAWWVSEPDDGLGDAVNKGFAMATGEIMAWLNSDDIHFSWTLRVVGEIFAQCPEVGWLTTGCLTRCSIGGTPASVQHIDGFARRLFFSGYYLATHPRWCGFHIHQEATFWRRSLWDQAGGRVITEPCCDFELWSRFWRHADLYTVPTPLGGFRVHPASLSVRNPPGWNHACMSILATCPEPRWGQYSLTFRRKACALLTRLRPLLAASAKAVLFDHAAGRWRTRAINVI